MIKEIIGDVIRAGKEEHGFICHQTNFRGVMGAGVALSIRQQLLTPEQYKEYLGFCYKFGEWLLGTNQYLECEDGTTVVNMFCQNYFVDARRNLTNYDAMHQCFAELLAVAEEQNKPIFIPGRIGCGIAGGDWYVVTKIIEEELGDAKVPVTIVYWEEEQ